MQVQDNTSSPHLLKHQATSSSQGFQFGHQVTGQLSDITPQDKMASKAFAWTNQNKKETLKMSTVESSKHVTCYNGKQAPE